MTVSFSSRSFREIVQAADPDFYFEGQHPVVYRWGGGKKERRDPGAQGAAYANNAVVLFVFVTEDGSRAFTSEAGDATFISEVKG